MYLEKPQISTQIASFKSSCLCVCLIAPISRNIDSLIACIYRVDYTYTEKNRNFFEHNRKYLANYYMKVKFNSPIIRFFEVRCC